MKFIQATIDELPAVIEIINHAKEYLALLGIDQWQNGYPNEAVMVNDIAHKECYIVQREDHYIMATAMFTTRMEPTYAVIEGKWLTAPTAVYGVIHRMAVHDDYRGAGMAQFIFDQCEGYLKENNIASMRIDTHHDNKGMQQLLDKRGYSRCGTIVLDDGSLRLAFEKLVD